MVWNEIETLPKDGREHLVCNVNQGGILALISWNRVHGYWQNKEDIECILSASLQYTHWTYITNIPKRRECKK